MSTLRLARIASPLGLLTLGSVEPAPEAGASGRSWTSSEPREGPDGPRLALVEFGHRAPRGVGAIVRALEEIGETCDVRECARASACPAMRDADAQLAEYFAGERASFDLGLFLPGTDFQQRVWRALLAIPCGEVRSYGDVAKGLGMPGASRAVGLANGANRVAIIVPCHRVIDSAGRLHGYGGGLEKKRWLLDHERAMRGDTLFAGACAVAPSTGGA